MWPSDVPQGTVAGNVPGGHDEGLADPRLSLLVDALVDLFGVPVSRWPACPGGRRRSSSPGYRRGRASRPPTSRAVDPLLLLKTSRRKRSMNWSLLFEQDRRIQECRFTRPVLDDGRPAAFMTRASFRVWEASGTGEGRGHDLDDRPLGQVPSLPCGLFSQAQDAPIPAAARHFPVLHHPTGL